MNVAELKRSLAASEAEVSHLRQQFAVRQREHERQEAEDSIKHERQLSGQQLLIDWLTRRCERLEGELAMKD